MDITQPQKAIGVFRSRSEAETALQELKHSGYPMERVSVIAQNAEQTKGMTGTETHERVGNKADEGATTGALTGGTLGGLTGLLVGLGTLAIPGVGPILLAGAAATAIATTVAGGAIGAAAGSLIGGLIGLGIPEERAKVYNERVKQGHYLLIVEGTSGEIERAEAILRRRGIEEWEVYGREEQPIPRTNYGQPEREMAYTNAVPAMSSTTQTPHLSHQRRAVGLFPNRGDAEAALSDLERAHFPKHQISLLGKDGSVGERFAGDGRDRSEGDLAARTKTDEGAKTGAATGGILGGLGGLLVGLGALAIPGIGPVIAGGALATALATTAAGGAIGAAAGGVTGALVGLGIPDKRAHFYNDRVNRGDYLVMVDGNQEEITLAEGILRRRGIQDWDVFDADNHQHSQPLQTNAAIDRQANQFNANQPASIDSINYVATPTKTTTDTSNSRRQAIAVFPNRQGVEQALYELRDSGFASERISIVATEANSHSPFAGIKTKNRIDDYDSLGIIEHEAHDYRDRLNRGQYLLLLNGTDEELNRVGGRLNRHGIERWEVYQVISNAPEVIVIDHRHQDRNPNL